MKITLTILVTFLFNIRMYCSEQKSNNEVQQLEILINEYKSFQEKSIEEFDLHSKETLQKVRSDYLNEVEHLHNNTGIILGMLSFLITILLGIGFFREIHFKDEIENLIKREKEIIAANERSERYKNLELDSRDTFRELNSDLLNIIDSILEDLNNPSLYRNYRKQIYEYKNILNLYNKNQNSIIQGLQNLYAIGSKKSKSHLKYLAIKINDKIISEKNEEESLKYRKIYRLTKKVIEKIN